MRTLRRILKHLSWTQRLLVLVLGCNLVLIVWGAFFVPATLATSDGIATLLAPLFVQGVIALLALVGPVSLHRDWENRGISLLFGVLFAVAYDGVVFLGYVGIPLDFNVWLLFVGAASLAGFLAGYQTAQVSRGVIAASWALVMGTAIWSAGILLMNYALWGTHSLYLAWLSDGAIDEFHPAPRYLQK